MNISGTISKLQRNMDKVGMIAGALCRGFNPLVENAKRLPTDGHIPDIEVTIDAFLRLPELKSAIMLYLFGWGASELGFGKYGNIAKKFTEGYLKGVGIQHLLFWSTHSTRDQIPAYVAGSRGSSGHSGGNSPSWRTGN